jgi:ATP-dependent DNA helicase RecG
VKQDKIMDLIRGGESEIVEFKESFNKETIETAGSFANTRGGIIFIGVSDEGKINGIQIAKEALNSWVNQISQSTEPRIIPEIEQSEIDGKTVVLILIKEFPIKPVSVKGRFFKRVGNSNRMMAPQEITELHLRSMGTSWDAFPAGNKTLEDIDLKKVERYMKEANATGRRNMNGSPQEVLEKLELVKDGRATWAAILLFGKDSQKPLVHCGRFRTDKIQIIDDFMIERDLISQVDEVMKFITRSISVRYEFEGEPRRKEVWDYPLEALREATINAIVHRDYTAPSDIQIEIYDDRLEVWNPGRLLPGITIDDLYKKEHRSVIRNKQIAQVFYDVGYIEKYGSGTIKMIELCKRQGLPSPDFREVAGGFSVIFRKDIYTEEYLRSLGLNDRQIKAVMYVKERGKITNRGYREMTGLSDEGVRMDVNELVEKGILLPKGRGRGAHYVLK